MGHFVDLNDTQSFTPFSLIVFSRPSSFFLFIFLSHSCFCFSSNLSFYSFCIHLSPFSSLPISTYLHYLTHFLSQWLSLVFIVFSFVLSSLQCQLYLNNLFFLLFTRLCFSSTPFNSFFSITSYVFPLSFFHPIQVYFYPIRPLMFLLHYRRFVCLFISRMLL